MKVKFWTILMLAAALFMSACGKSDADLQKAATDKLAAEKVAGVNVTVKDGVATLTGEVADITVKNKAEAAVKGVEGIKSVNATLKALPPPPPPSEDQMLEGKINENLKKISIDNIKVVATNGEVTLNGEVESKEALTKAMQAANEAKPKKVINNLTVKK
jgi:hyperosmotically inducible protein